MSIPNYDARRPQRRDRARDKALLIGIEYRLPAIESGVPPLSTPHKDVREFRTHLIRKWGYQAQNITVMLDKPGHPASLQPTKPNILREIDKLASQAQAGDHLVFYFAGHCYQLVSDDEHEPDGYDEAILTMDYTGEPIDKNGLPLDPNNILDEDRHKLDGLIVDNELRRRLVDALHHDARLVSIFDTCHSGTLLDLTHYWKNKIKRALSLPSRNLKLEQAFPVSLNKGKTKPFPRISMHGSTTLNSHASSGTMQTFSSPPVIIRTDSFEMPLSVSPTTTEFQFDDEERGENAAETRPKDIVIRSMGARDRREERSFQQASLVPVPSCSTECSSGRSSPYVLSIAPAEDHEVTYENQASNDRSFTSSLINVLDEAETGVSLKEFMERLRFRIFMGVTQSLAGFYKKKKRSLGEVFHKNRRFIMTNAVPNPQIGSMHPLDLNAEIDL